MFLDGPKEEQHTPRELSLKMLDKLADMGAKNVNEMLMRDRGEKKQGYGNDKIRYTFSFDNRDQAMVCYNYFMNR